MKTQTAWQATRLPRFKKITRPSQFDVTVVGGGITGLTTTYLLKKAGKKVCLLERERLAGGDTGCTTAHLTYVTDLRLSEPSRRLAATVPGWHGREGPPRSKPSKGS